MTQRIPASDAGFRQFELDSRIHEGIDALGFTEPRPIQAKTIPAGLEGRDVLGLAQTGTGKTAAFAVPILQRLLSAKRPGPRALIVAPTRELATPTWEGRAVSSRRGSRRLRWLRRRRRRPAPSRSRKAGR